MPNVIAHLHSLAFYLSQWIRNTVFRLRHYPARCGTCYLCGDADVWGRMRAHATRDGNEHIICGDCDWIRSLVRDSLHRR